MVENSLNFKTGFFLVLWKGKRTALQEPEDLITVGRDYKLKVSRLRQNTLQ